MSIVFAVFKTLIFNFHMLFNYVKEKLNKLLKLQYLIINLKFDF